MDDDCCGYFQGVTVKLFRCFMFSVFVTQECLLTITLTGL